jgi:type II secretory pathway component GspD/PulD (secretin)
MSSITRSRIGVGLAVLVLCLGFYAARAQEDNASLVFAQKGAPSPQQVTSPAAQGKTPRLIAMDFLIAEVGPGREGSNPGSAELHARELSGPMNQVMDRVEALKKTGQVRYFRRIQLSACEGQAATVSISELRPSVSGVTTASTGHTSRSINYRNTGTNVKATARVTSDGHVLMDVNVEDTRGHVPEDGIVVGTDEKGQPVRAEEWITAKLTTQFSVASGRAKAAEAVTTFSKAGQAQTLVIAGARIEEQ